MEIKILFPSDNYEEVIVNDVVTFETEFGDSNTICVWDGKGGYQEFEGIGATVTEATEDGVQ